MSISHSFTNFFIEFLRDDGEWKPYEKADSQEEAAAVVKELREMGFKMRVVRVESTATLTNI